MPTCLSATAIFYPQTLKAIIANHPRGGHRSVMPHLDRFIQHIKSKGDVWIATRAEVASYRKKNVLDASTH